MSELNPQSEALRWLLEMEIVNDPNVLNSLILNIHKASDRIQDVEVVLDTPHKRMLVYLDVDCGWWRQATRQQEIHDAVANMLDEALPSYTHRVVFDRTVLNKALELVNK